MSLASQIRAQLQTHNLPPPSQTWLQTLVSARTPPPPLPSLVMTAKTRLLASDLTTLGLLDPTAVPAMCFPPGITNLQVKETRLGRDVYAQVLDIENLSQSRWEQIEELEAIDRGEQTRGREMIRLPVGGEAEEGEMPPDQRPAAAQRNQGGAGAGSKNATHKLVLQDCKGQNMFGLELKRIERIAIGKLNIGEKILLRRGAVVARGTVLLEPATCVILGGKIEAWHKVWTDRRLARLKAVVGPNVGG